VAEPNASRPSVCCGRVVSRSGSSSTRTIRRASPARQFSDWSKRMKYAARSGKKGLPSDVATARSDSNAL
jgi:hypothetical protein